MFLGCDTGCLCLQFDLLTVLIGTGLEENIITFFSLETCNAVSQYDLLFVCTSQHRPLRVRNPIRCNRRILSQPCFYRSYSPRYPFGAPLRSHLLYLSVPFLSALRNVLCKTSMINTLFLIAFAYSYSSTGNPDCQCSFVSFLLIADPLFLPVPKWSMPEA